VDVASVVTTVAAVVGSASVFTGAWSLRQSRDQATTAFEDSLAREYRDIASELPPAAFYRPGKTELSDEAKGSMFRYFDLSNEQLRLIGEGRIRSETAAVWRAGIEDLMRRDTFGIYWNELQEGLPSDFLTLLKDMTSTSGQNALPEPRS
jgi:hypothetical protein